MGLSPYLERLRRAVGTELVIVPGAAGIVRDADGRVLLLRRADDDRWDLPGGATDPGETPARTAEREVQEESGLRVRATRVAGVFGGGDFRRTYPDGGNVEGVVVVFHCDVIGGELRPQHGEATDARYFDVATMPVLAFPYPRDLFDGVSRPAIFDPADGPS